MIEDMTANNDVFSTGLTLHIDGDILIYQSCCIFNEDTEEDRLMIERQVCSHIKDMMLDARCDDYKLFLTSKINFRDLLVSDYKANRSQKERPVNLVYAKRYAMHNLNSFCMPGLEADDLIGIAQHENSVIWSLDKDLRQIPGKHLDDKTRKVFEIDHLGRLEDTGKVYFTGLLGFFFQLLTGDTSDYILGCGVRELGVYKTGSKKGQQRIRRVGVGPKEAYKLLKGLGEKEALEVVIRTYKKWFPKNYKENMETQANLLFMVREIHGDLIKRWTMDGRTEYMNYKTGVILDAKEAEEAKTNGPKEVPEPLRY